MKKPFYLLVWLSLIATKCVSSQPEKDNSFNHLLRQLREPLNEKFFEFALKNEKVLFSKNYDDDLCLKEIEAIQNGISNSEMWALEVLDSWGKIPSGILWGHLTELGNFEECLSVTKTFNESKYENQEHTLKGQYCFAQLSLQSLGLSRMKSYPIPRDGNTAAVQAALKFGVCVPKSCQPLTVDVVFREMLKDLGINLSNSTAIVIPGTCKSNDALQFKTIDYVAISFFSAIALLMLLSTIVDFTKSYYKRSNSKIDLFCAFSVRSNGSKLFQIQNYHNSVNVIECLNGIRSLSIIWIVFGHQYAIAASMNFINPVKQLEWFRSPFSLLLQNGTISVDSFFLLSGCLLTWIAFKTMEKSKGKLNIPLMYFHRYIRLTPLVAATILFNVTVYRYFGNGPFWYPELTAEVCEKNWWSTLLYVQNYVHGDKMCVGHTWYLAVDTQLYILSPLVLIPLWKWGKIAFLPIIIAIQCSIAYVFAEFMYRDYHLLLLEMNTNDLTKQENTYYPTHARVSPYLIGVVLGYYLFQYRNKKIEISRFRLVLGWIMSIFVILVILFGNYHRVKYQPTSGTTTIEYATYEAFSRFAWAVALAWIVFVCHRGYGGVVNTILSWGIWQPIARLSYSIYITHIFIQMIILGYVKVDQHFSDLQIILMFWGSFGITLMVSVVTVLAFESPILVIENFIFKRKTEPTQEKITLVNFTTQQDK